ncbi:hypothetical protein AB0I28_21315 [Phytomonospora sp. NPDC050363]|uniref:hypothetical protein n=1 Tax=Phytomonospora sp. NPDC050363 TaxID=3155642 RepID=UPI0033E3B21A
MRFHARALGVLVAAAAVLVAAAAVLVVGGQNETFGTAVSAGGVWVIPGGASGLDTTRTTLYTQNSPGVPGGVEFHDYFGAALSAGNITGGAPYLIVGSPGESVGSREYAGMAYYLRGEVWRTFGQNTAGVAGTAEAGDSFGGAIAASDRFFAVGAQGEELNYKPGAGTAHLFAHTIVGGAPKPIAAVHQDTSGISGSAETNDSFGSALSVVSYRPSPTAAIGALVAVGVSGEDLGSATDAGMAHLLAITPTGTVTEVADAQQNTSGVADTAEEDDMFGADVAVAIRGTAPVGTPSTVVWAAAVGLERTGASVSGAVQVFRNPKDPGDRDVLVTPGSHGTSPSDFQQAWGLGASPAHLVMTGVHEESVAVPWNNILNGATEPVVRL